MYWCAIYAIINYIGCVKFDHLHFDKKIEKNHEKYREYTYFAHVHNVNATLRYCEEDDITDSTVKMQNFRVNSRSRK